MKNPVNTPVSIKFEYDNEGKKMSTPQDIDTKSLGFANKERFYFSTRVPPPEFANKINEYKKFKSSKKNESKEKVKDPNNDYDDLIIKGTIPFPEEACKKKYMDKCFENLRFVNPQSHHIECGLYNENAYYSPTELTTLIKFSQWKGNEREFDYYPFDGIKNLIAHKEHIEKKIKEYEDKINKNFSGKPEERKSVAFNWAYSKTVSRCNEYRRIKDGVHPDTQGSIFENEDAVFITMRGTEGDSTNDILTDISVLTKVDLAIDENKSQWSGGKGKLALGFHNAAVIIKNSLAKELKKMQAKWAPEVNKPIFITGHSLGGAVATILTYDLLRRNANLDSSMHKPFNIKALYTFGAPRVGNREWAEHMMKLANDNHVGIFRFVNKDDVVPRMPCLGYYHVGTTVYVENNKSEDGISKVFTAINPISKLIEINLDTAGKYPISGCAYGSALGSIFKLKKSELLSALSNHPMDNYYDALRALYIETSKKLENESSSTDSIPQCYSSNDDEIHDVNIQVISSPNNNSELIEEPLGIPIDIGTELIGFTNDLSKLLYHAPANMIEPRD